jgi:phage shock protein A
MGFKNLLTRIGKIFEAKANEEVDKNENPVLMTKQAIRDLKAKRQSVIEGEVKLKTLIANNRADAEKKKAAAAEWENKATLLLTNAKNGTDQEKAEADDLTATALGEQQACLADAKKLTQDADAQQKNLDAIAAKLADLDSLIKETEQNLTSLEARETSATVQKEVSKTLATDAEDSTRALLERISRKVETDEHEAAAYAEMDSRSIEKKIDDAVSKGQKEKSTADALAALKSKIGA